LSIFILIIVAFIVVVVIYFRFNYYSATKGIIRSNLNAFFKAKSQGMNSEEALHFMILTRYSVFPQKRGEFIPLYATFLSYLKNPETSDMDIPDALGVLSVVLGSFDLHHEILENITEREKEELETLRGVISLMHIYEAGAVFRSPHSFGFPTLKFLDNFIYNIDTEYHNRIGQASSKTD